MVQGDFTRDGHGNLEAVILTEGTLQHRYRDLGKAPDYWAKAQVITTGATAPGCIIQSTFGIGEHRN